MTDIEYDPRLIDELVALYNVEEGARQSVVDELLKNGRSADGLAKFVEDVRQDVASQRVYDRALSFLQPYMERGATDPRAAFVELANDDPELARLVSGLMAFAARLMEPLYKDRPQDR